MKVNTLNKVCIYTALLCSLAATAFPATQTVITYPQSQQSEQLNTRWEWAANESEQFRDGYWIGYSIEYLMSPRSFFGSGSNSNRERKPTLEMVIECAENGTYVYEDDPQSQKESSRNDFSMWSTSDGSEEKVIKDVAILFYFEGSAGNPADIKNILLSNTTLHVNLMGKPLIWLGDSALEESAEHIIGIYPDISAATGKKRLITAIGIHQNSSVTVPFLKDVINSDQENKIRKNAVFWLAEQDNSETLNYLKNLISSDRFSEISKEAVFGISRMQTDGASETLFDFALNADNIDIRKEAVFWLAERDDPGMVPFLCEIIETDTSQEVRKSAVFGLSRIESDPAIDALIDIARNSNNTATSKEAIFWLGQIASKKATDALESVVYKTDTIELQKQAVFALSQSGDNSGISALIKIAGDHPSTAVRKEAIFWLGESGDPRALETIVGIIRNQ